MRRPRINDRLRWPDNRAGAASAMVRSLLEARTFAQQAGAVKALARINAAIRSARGAKAYAFNVADRARLAGEAEGWEGEDD